MDDTYNNTQYHSNRRFFEPRLIQTKIRSSLLPRSCITFHFFLEVQRFSVVETSDGSIQSIGELEPLAIGKTMKLLIDYTTTMSHVQESLSRNLEYLPLWEDERLQVIMHACAAARESVSSIQNIRDFNINLEFKLRLQHETVFHFPSSSSTTDEPLEKYGVRVADKIDGEDQSCCICLDDLLTHGAQEVMSTPCHHVFHGCCLKIWFDQHSTCPLCRFQMPITS